MVLDAAGEISVTVTKTQGRCYPACFLITKETEWPAGRGKSEAINCASTGGEV